VPAAVRCSLEAALSGKPDDVALHWLVEEDLLTTDLPIDRSDKRRPLPVVTDVSVDLAGACNMECAYCFEEDIDSRLGPMSRDTMLATVSRAFEASANAPRVTFHFGSGEPLVRFQMLRDLVHVSEARARKEGREVRFELTTNATLVTDEISRFLRDHSFNVRVSFDGPPRVHDTFRPLLGGRSSYTAVTRGLQLLIAHLPDRVTVNSVLSHPTRLRDLWNWATGLGIRRLHVIKVGASPGRELNLEPRALEYFVADLRGICRDIITDLEAGRRPIDYQPITKIIRRLMIPQPITRFCGVAGSYLGVRSDGEVYPCFRHVGLEQYHLGNVHEGANADARRRFLSHEAADVDRRPACNSCWARHLCGGGCYADSTIYGPDLGGPQLHHCFYWRAEIEAALRLYGQLLALDPRHCLRLFGDTLLELDQDTPSFLQQSNCT